VNGIVIFIKEVVSWCLTGKYHWITFFVVLLTILYLLKVLTLYTSFISSVFTISGVIIILAQQLREAKQFSQYNPNTISNWIKSFPKLVFSKTEKRKLNLEGSITCSTSVRAELSSKISEHAPIDSKIRWTIEEINILNDKVRKLEKTLNESNHEFSAKINRLSNNFRNVRDSVDSIIAGHTVGAYDQNLLGIMLTLCGTLIQIFSSV
jgi:hypothetical protein